MNTSVDAERLHESTKHGSPPSHPESLVAYQRLDPANAPRPFKEYRGSTEIPLPPELVASALPATAVLSGQKGDRRELDSGLLTTLLFLSAGVTRTIELPGRTIYFRTAMSAGNLHPVELYVVAGDGGVEGLSAGVYHFSPLSVGLTLLRSGDFRGVLGADSPLAIVLTGIPWRTTWKYGERGWRHLYWDTGTMLANLLAVADAHGLDHRTVLGFDDSGVSRLLGIDGANEMPLAVALLGQDAADPPPPPPLDPLSLDVAPVAPAPFRLPLLEDAQTGSTLSGEEVESWRSQGPKGARSAPGRVTAPNDSADPIEQVILRRGSTRKMLHRSVPAAHLDWPMAAATRSAGIDAVGEGTLLEHYVNVHDVEGMDPGAFHYTGSGWELTGQADSLRGKSASLCLGQALGGDSAYTVFHCAELESVLEVLGSRGYRVAQLEAGVVSGRLALCAFAVGLGATGLTFLDDAVTRFFETSAQPMLVTSVGVPTTPPAPAGTPGKPVTLRRT